MRQKFIFLLIVCFGLSSNVLFSQITPGSACNDEAVISLVGGSGLPINCVGDGTPNEYTFSSTVVAQPFGYIVTDSDNVILAITLSNTIDLEPFGPGSIRVWGFTFLGQLIGQVGQDADEAQLGSVCSELSTNFIEFVNIVPDGGTVSTIDGSSSEFVCVGDNNLDEITFTTTSSNSLYAYFITYEDNTIVGILDNNSTFQFNDLPEGVCRVYGVAYGGVLTAQVGDLFAEVPIASECFDISDNFVEIIKTVPDGGTVSLDNNETEIIICASDNAPDVLSFLNQSSSPAPYTFIIVDENGVILQVLDSNTAEFNALPGGFVNVYGVSFTGTFTGQVGDNIADAALSDDCFELSQNFVTVLRNDVDGGDVALEDGSTSAFACVNDGIADEFTVVSTSTSSEAFIYVVTDDNNIILAFSEDGMLNFEGAGIGVCRVWGLSYSGTLLAEEGDDAAAVMLSTECFELSSNFVEVSRSDVDGGEVSLEGGDTEIAVCVGDDEADALTFVNTSTSSDTYLYVITDENNVILAVNSDGVVDFDGAGPGICRVWGLSYSGNLTADAGDNAAEIDLSDACFELSSNFVTVNRSEVDGGNVSLENGDLSIDLCVNDGNPDVLTFVNTTTSSEAYVFIVTDENDIILQVNDTGVFDFESAGFGICRVWGLSASGNLTIPSGANLTEIDLSTLCFELSENFVTVNRKEVDGGEVSFEDGSDFAFACVNDGEADEFTVVTTATLGSTFNYTYVITDDQNNILAFNDLGQIDFDGAGVGVCRVWGLSFTGMVTAQAGDNAAEVALTDDCYALSSNFVTIERSDVNGGGVTLSTGGSSIGICVNDGIPDVLTFDRFTTSTSPYAFVVTDDNNIIIAVLDGDTQDFEGAGAGVCRVWGLSYSGDIIAQAGDDAAAVDLASGCFDLSGNFVTVTRNDVEGASVSLADGGDLITLCLGDAAQDTFTVVNTSTSVNDYAYVITDDQNNILGISESNLIDLTAAPEGICRVWGLSYSGDIIAEIGDNAADVALTDECFELSSNFVEAVRILVDGGDVSLENGDTTLDICTFDGNTDFFTVFNTTTSSQNYVFILTDENNRFLDASEDGVFGWSSTNIPSLVLHIWGLSYTGDLIVETLEDITTVALSDECFDLSDNFVEVTTYVTNGGTVATSSGETTVYVCNGDGNPDVISFDSTGTIAESYVYVITDDANVILGIADADSFDFDEAPDGICRVWGLAYSGDIIASVGDNAAEVALTSKCFDLSENFITVVREVPEAGEVFTAGEELIVFTCPGDGNDDIIVMDSVGTSSSPYAYVITDGDFNVLDILAEGDILNFENAGTGACNIFGVAYTGNLTVAAGDNIFSAILSDDCADLSDNFVTVFREVPEGGTISLENGETVQNICPGDGNQDFVSYFPTGIAFTPFVYVVTDDQNIILSITQEDELEFDAVPPGTCRIWGLSYTGNLIAQVGENAALVALSDDCFDLSDNFITLIREEPNAGEITGIGEGNEITVCKGDGMPNVIEFGVSNQSQTPYTYAITDQDGFLLTTIDEDSFDFEQPIPGVYRVYGIAYTGVVTGFPGDNIFEFPLSTDCWAVSDTFIEITIIEVDGGEVQGNGTDIVYVCPDDDVDDIVTFTNTSITGGQYTYLLTTPTNVIIGLVDDGEQNFENTGFTELRVWGVSYTGNFTGTIGSNAAEAMLSDECFVLSDNFVTVFRDQPEESTVSTADGDTELLFCIENGDYDLEMANTSASLAGYVYLLTDMNNIIISVNSGAVNFENIDFGMYRIWGLNYTGDLLAEPGMDAAVGPLASSCHILSSNFVTVTRGEEVDGGTISTEVGLDTVYVCPMDGIPDLVVLNTTSADTNYVYVITDNEGNIIVPNVIGNVINFDAAGPGICRIYGVSFTGVFNASFGDEVGIDALSTECSAVSTNYITLIREMPEGGTVSTADGLTEVEVEVGDGIPDEITFTNTGASMAQYSYVITDADNFIIGFPDGDTQDFEGVVEGVCRVWGLSYTGNVIAFPGDNAAEVDLTDGCFDLSDNFITVTRVQGGSPGELNGTPETVAQSTAIDVELNIAPNPAINTLMVNFEIDQEIESTASLQVIGLNGQVIATQNVMIQQGLNQFELDITEVPSGMNFVRLVSERVIESTNFIKLQD